jgi:hypothetical protein
MSAERHAEQAADLAEINRLIAVYNDRTDVYDFEGVANCFTPDGVFHGAYGAPWNMRADWRTMSEQADERAAKAGRTRHFVTNTLTELDGDRATSKSFLLVTRMPPKGPPVIALTGEYHDDLVRHEGRWLFARRVVVLDAAPDGRTPPDPLTASAPGDGAPAPTAG